MTSQVDCISLYGGAGGIDEGLRQVGIKTKLMIDIWKDACETFKLNHPDTEVICGKVSDYENSLPKTDIIVGGPPCQTFSYNNPNRVNDMTQVNTFIKIVGQLKPRFYLMENVRGLYKLLDWNQKYLVKLMSFGIPQNRVRALFTNIPIPTISEYKTVKDVIDTKNYKFIFKSGNTHQNRKVRTKPVDGLCDTVTASDRFYLTDHQIVSEKYGFNFNVPKEELTLQQYAQLQGFPKEYKFYGSQSSIRKQIGNAVPPPVTKTIFSQLMVIVK